MSRYDLVTNRTPYAVDLLELVGGRATVSVNGVTDQVNLSDHILGVPVKV